MKHFLNVLHFGNISNLHNMLHFENILHLKISYIEKYMNNYI
jgi:hypothetical protein